MSYIVFARKYRPQAFDEVVGQSHITTTLKNAIAQDRVAHAYIFAGPRGVGKTTTARILAKALNCEKGPTDNPCNKCPSCTEITQGISLDILEIDGASNRGIDEIRNLRENVKFSPSKGRFKVYIIDEVHMLTPEAFNALLKTLEEPPPHVKFIFATTQAHKVPPTILSRCQRFDFRRISIKDTVSSLKAIAKKESIKVDDEALILISKNSDGSMRDAQVVLDQIASFTEGKVEIADIYKILGTVSDDILFSLADAISDRDAVKALKLTGAFTDEGKDVVGVILHLIEHFRNLSVIKVSSQPAGLIDASEEKMKRYVIQAQKFTVEQILYIIYTLSNTIDFARKSNTAKVPFEVAMVKLARAGAIMPSEELLERLENLEKRLGSGNEPQAAKPIPGLPAPLASLGYGARGPGVVASAGAGSVDEIISVWPAVINCIKERKISVAMYLKEGMPLGMEANALTIEFPRSSKFHKDMLDSPECKSLISTAVKDVSGLDIRIKFTVSDSDAANRPAGSGAADEQLGIASAQDAAATEDPDDPIISNALELFGGEIKTGKVKKQ